MSLKQLNATYDDVASPAAEANIIPVRWETAVC